MPNTQLSMPSIPRWKCKLPTFSAVSPEVQGLGGQTGTSLDGALCLVGIMLTHSCVQVVPSLGTLEGLLNVLRGFKCQKCSTKT
jgi:hypothetical protein